jgi:MFS family permease
MSIVLMTEMVPPARYGQFAAYMGIPAVLSLGLGPLIGGGIVSTTTGRWVFLTWRRVDIVGSARLFLAMLALTAGFSEADSQFA